MKKILPVVFLVTFLLGITLILTADTGMVANYASANIAGSIISLFSGVYLGIYFFHLYRAK